MKLDPPDLAALRAYLDETLADDEADAVRRWLIVAATPEVLTMLEDLAAEHERARARLAYWAGHPPRARLARLAWRARCVVGNSVEIDLGQWAPLEGILGADRARFRSSGARRTLEVSPGRAYEVLVGFAEAAWAGVYAVGRDGSLTVLSPGSIRHVAGDRVEVGGIIMDAGDAPLDMLVVFDPHGPLPAPPADADATWLATLLESAAAAVEHAGRSVLWTTLQVTEPR